MNLTNEELRHVARLARLDVTDAEIERLRGSVADVLEYVGKLAECDTDGVEEAATGTSGTNVFRDDVIAGAGEETRGRIVGAFPRRAGDLLEVGAVFADRN